VTSEKSLTKITDPEFIGIRSEFFGYFWLFLGLKFSSKKAYLADFSQKREKTAMLAS